MKKFLKWFLLPLITLILLTVMTLAGILFYRPQVFIKSKNLAWVMNKTHVLKTWSWSDFQFNHEWKSWNDRIFQGHFKNFCFEQNGEAADVKTCLEEISWNFEVVWQKGFKTKTLQPFKVRSSFLIIGPKEDQEKKKTPPPDVYGYWSKFWSDLTPDVDVYFKKITIKDKNFDFKLVKEAKKLEASALGFKLAASPKGFTLYAPTPYLFPKKLPTDEPVYFRNVKLRADVNKKGIPLVLTGTLEAIKFSVNSVVDLPLKEEVTSIAFRREVLLKTTAQASLHSIKGNFARYAPDKYKTLPAPLNEMDGNIFLKVTTASHTTSSVIVKAVTNIELESVKQALIMEIGTSAPIDLKTFESSDITLDLNFKRIALLLPHISKKKLPPQFLPDSRIKSSFKEEKQKALKKGPNLEILLLALNEKSLNIKTDLLDEVLRLNFKLKISEGHIQEGFVRVLPLKTKVFKRPVQVTDLKITFNYPIGPVIEATVIFPLPEYKITLKMEGPVSNPRYAFSSVPPLPENDIYGVLLFGRPMADLSSDDKSAARKTSQILSQGILSMSVLYFLTGSPVEYVGYNAESNTATAQFGLGKKTSLSVGGNQGGLNSTGIRRSLGKGWYLDTSVQNPGPSASSTTNKNYGVLLERIIAY